MSKKLKVLAPIVTADTINRIVICPTCKHVIYDSDWTKKSIEKNHVNYCLNCFQRLTPTGKCLGYWDNEIHSEKYLWQIREEETNE